MPLPIELSPGKKVHISELPTRIDDGEWTKGKARKRIHANALEMADLARRLYAENRRSILLVLQGMDTAGKDSTIRTVMRGVNPRSCQVVSFKKPSEEELDHDFLWRVHKVVPRTGNIGIFNRSHYEDVLVVRVHNLVPPDVWEARYELINDFEKLLRANGTVLLKCFLHIGKEEQRKRLQARIDNPDARWKFNPRDLEERKLWSEYQTAYEVALDRCTTSWAPWYVVPSDRKWYRNLLVSELLTRTLERMAPQYPRPSINVSSIVVE